MWTIFKFPIEFVTILFLFSGFFFFPLGLWDLNFSTGDQTSTTCIGRWRQPLDQPRSPPRTEATWEQDLGSLCLWVRAWRDCFVYWHVGGQAQSHRCAVLGSDSRIISLVRESVGLKIEGCQGTAGHFCLLALFWFWFFNILGEMRAEMWGEGRSPSSHSGPPASRLRGSWAAQCEAEGLGIVLPWTCGMKPLMSLCVLVCKTERLAKSVLRFLTGRSRIYFLWCVFMKRDFLDSYHFDFFFCRFHVAKASGQGVCLRSTNLPLSSQALDGNEVTRSGIHVPLASYIRLTTKYHTVSQQDQLASKTS